MPDIQTALKDALKNTPLAMSTIQRIWLWLKDHPANSSKRIAAELKVPMNSISSLMSQLHERKMTIHTMSRQQGKDVLLHSVNPSMRGVYELLPSSKSKHKMKSPFDAEMPAVVMSPTWKEVDNSPPAIQPVRVDRSETDFAVDVDSLTVAEARSLWVVLNRMFGK